MTYDVEYDRWYSVMVRQIEKDMEITSGVIVGVVHVYEIWIEGVLQYEVINTQARSKIPI